MQQSNVISCIEKLLFPFKTLDPFLFCVFHEDFYPEGDDKMQAPIKGNGSDFTISDTKKYRMYHGDRVPGFPQHPHRGFETLTCTINGIIDHTDSMGNAGRYGEGDLQWLTCGKGICHAEMFPLINNDKPNHCKFFQIWLNLPKKSKMVEPSYVMHWHEKIPIIYSDDKLTKIRLWAGELESKVGLDPPTNSYGASKDSELAVIYLELSPGAKYVLPPCKRGNEINRRLYFIDGEVVSIAQKLMNEHCVITVKGSESVELNVPQTSKAVAGLLLLQGRPINEPVAQHGPFVMNTREEIVQV